MRYLNDGVRVRAYCGAVGTGKTQKLVEECKALVEAGEAPAGILVLSASASAAQTLHVRLEAAGVAGVRVTTPMAWALEVLDGEAARAFTGREAHVLNAYEQDFFFEDMRVQGTKQHRLREMLKFFYRGWSEMRDDEPDWLVTVEEKEISRLAKADLAMLRAYHPSEVTAACVRYLASDAAALAKARVPHVLADDWQAMSRASQRLCGFVAGKGLTVAWNDTTSLVGEEAYGYAEGLDGLAQACPQLERIELAQFKGSECAYGALANLYKQECVAGQSPLPGVSGDSGGAGTSQAVEVRMVGTLDEEPASVVQAVREAIAVGMSPDDIFVVAGRGSWLARVQDSLEEAGIPTSWVEGRAHLRGDIRDPEKCADMAMANALRLVADPASCVAWRCWCGFGDYLGYSAAFSDLARALEGSREVRLTDLLFALVGEGDLEVCGDMLNRGRIEERVRAGKALIAQARGLAGEQLIEAVRAHVCAQGQPTPDFDALVGGDVAGMGAAELAARIDAGLAPQMPLPGHVRMGLPDALLGQTPRVLVLCGLTNGLYPEKGYFDLLERTIDDQAKMHARLIAQLIEVCGKAGERLVLSGFRCADILDAEPMKLATERIRLRNRRRVCEFGPSVVVDYITGAKTAYVR